MLVDRDENKVTSFKLTKYDFAAAHLDWTLSIDVLIDGDGNVNNSRERATTDIPFDWLQSHLFMSWTKKNMFF
jgi:hypothetical protein